MGSEMCIRDSIDIDNEESPQQELHNCLSSDYLDLVALAEVIGDQTEQGALNLPCADLADPPIEFRGCFSACLGDAFHAMNRPKVAVKHEYKKPYFVALQQAFFAWRPELLAEVKDVLASHGISKEEIDGLMYYNVDFFRQRVDRRILPPCQLYWRVRAVYALFGNKVDSQTSKPLFNQRAWSKANNVLKEILLGYYSDPPGFTFYTNRLDQKGEPMIDRYGIALLDCNRGTNSVEAIHKQLVALYGTWNTGVEMSDALLSERRHRYNHKINERKRLGFPKIGHFDTWQVDALQLLVEKNHNVLLFPDWSNSSDYKSTPESFGTVALHSQEIHEELEKVVIAKDVSEKFSSEMKYIARAMGVKIPFLPLHGSEEAKLFSHLVLSMPTAFHDLLMALEWIKHVNGSTIFPKLPVYLRMYHERWERNQRVRDAVRNSKTELQLLQQVNNKFMLLTTGALKETDEMDSKHGGSASDTLLQIGDDIDDGISQNGSGNDSDLVLQLSNPVFPWANVAAPTPVAQPHFLAIRPSQQLGPPIVGGLLIGLSNENMVERKARKRGRGNDVIPQK